MNLPGFWASSFLQRLNLSVRCGLPYSVFERIQGVLGVSAQALAALIGVPVRKLNKRKHEGRFSSEKSDNLLQVVRIVSKTFDFFDAPA